MSKLLLYCTKAKPYLKSHSEYEYNEKGAIPETRKRVFTIYQNKCDYYNGKIVAECDFEVEKIRLTKGLYLDEDYITDTLREKEILKYSCLSYCELANYLGGKNGYAIHIKNLNIFDNPRFIQDYSKNENPYNYIENAPSNMMYAYDVKSFNNFEKKILISIKPQEMCRIANKEQTVLVRKRVLKEMLKNE